MGKSRTRRHIEDKNISNLRNERFKCDNCELKFTSRSQLNRHTLNQHGPKPKLANKEWHKCPKCSDRFAKPESLKKHLEIHNGKNLFYKCEYCEKKFKSRWMRKYHAEKTHKIKLHNCDFCEASFILRSRLLVHLQIHKSDQEAEITRDYSETTTSKKFFRGKCPTCNHIFSHKTHFKNHLLWHENPNIFACTVCKKQFQRNASLTIHMRLHEKKKQFSCEFCGKEFTRFDALNVHLRNHTGERPYKCEECLELFTTSGLCDTHACTKAPEKKRCPKNQCKICLKFLASTANLKEHMNVHSGLKPLSCKYCSMKFSFRTMVSSHVRKKHPEHTKKIKK